MLYKYKGIPAYKVSQKRVGVLKRMFLYIKSIFSFKTKLGKIGSGEDAEKIKEQLALSRRFWISSSAEDFIIDVIEADSHEIAILKLIHNGIFPFEIEDISNYKERRKASTLNNLREFKRKLESGEWKKTSKTQ